MTTGTLAALDLPDSGDVLGHAENYRLGLDECDGLGGGVAGGLDLLLVG